MPKNSSKVSTFTLKRIRDLKNNMINMFSKVLDDLLEHILACHYFSLNPFVTSPGDLRDLGRPFRYEARRSPGLIT